MKAERVLQLSALCCVFMSRGFCNTVVRSVFHVKPDIIECAEELHGKNYLSYNVGCMQPLAISGFFSMHFTIQRLKNAVRYISLHYIVFCNVIALRVLL